MLTCPLCFNKEKFTHVEGPESKPYWMCNNCMLIFIEACSRPPVKVEKERYLTHNNGIQHKGYVDFLNQAIRPALPFLNKHMEGLDFGCGPVPTLSILLEQKGFSCKNYDPLFFPELPGEKFDFVFATECFEHFFTPANEIALIKKLLKQNGCLIVMTQAWESIEAFPKWHYARDLTHVSFYHKQTFKYISKKYNFQAVENDNNRVFIFIKQIAHLFLSSHH